MNKGTPVLVVIAICIGFMFVSIPYTNTKNYSQCLITDKDRAVVNNKSDMRVYTTCGTFRTKDMLFAGEFDSADTYASLVPGNTYDIETTGYRIPFFSSFPIIREVK